ncbi:MAG: hypothetical protein IJV82_05450, partial [Oscillospiraceae bacterium]|nr:hypothetical protein [Oscillospiraceae bacterium]
MKQVPIKSRIISLLLCAALVLGLVPVLSRSNPVHAATESQNNIVARADYFYNITWTCKQDVYGWNYNTLFSAGTTYRIPYGQPIYSGAYIGYYVEIDDFLTAANTAGSVFYTSRSTYDTTSSVYYATDCSAFVSWCWGVDRKTTYSIPQISTYIGMATAANTSLLQLGDCLNSNDVGHVVLVTDLIYNSSGTLTSIEITEQTPPQMKRSYWTPSELGSYYGTYYGIYRYSGTVPAAPDGSTNSGSSSGSITSKYYPACDSSQTSLIPAMASIGVTLDWDLQTKIAEANGITDFSGTAEQNTTLLNLLKAGKLLNPNYVPVTYYPACSSSATTFYGGMSEIGVTCDWDLHTRIAQANGITDFSGTAEQNESLLALLKAGKLINPDASGDTGSTGGSGSSGTVTSGSNGYERGYTGGMAGTGEYKAFGLDVSSWQGSDLSFTRIKNAGYDYVILRAGTSNGKDECFETYYTNAKAAGLDVGAYYYTYATSVSAVQSDMEDFLSYISGKTFEYPIYFDYESSDQQALSASVNQQICLTAMDMLAAEGYLVGMYTGKYFSTLLPIDTICAKYEIWIAHYLAVGDGSYDGTNDYTTYGPTYSTQYGMYQFTDSVWINGYGPYDGDVCYKDYPSIVKTYGFNGYEAEIQEESYIDKNCTFYPSHGQLKVTTATTVKSEPRSASDDLETAALDAKYVANGLYINGGGNLWYRVTTASGATGYIYSGRVEYVKSLYTDVTITGHGLPSNHVVGNVFSVNGTVSSTYNTLDKVGVHIYSGTDISASPLTGGSASASNNKYSLSGSTIDDATSFGDLAIGTHTYLITAECSSYYAATTKELGTVKQTVNLVKHPFKVISASTSTSDYFANCTFYPSHCTFTTIQDTGIFSEPRTEKTGNTSMTLEAAPNGTTYTSTGLYLNSGGNIFYRVKTADGLDGYIYSGYTEFGKKVYSDIKISGYTAPNAHVKGNVFVVAGTIKSTYNTLGTAKVSIYSGFGTSGEIVTGGSDTITNNKYVLAGSAIDDATSFGDLPLGQYTYVIQATYTSYYAVSAKELGTITGTRTIKKAYFTVVSSAVDSSTCTHSNSETVIEKATCTETGTKVVSCSKCGLTEKVTIEIDESTHDYGSYVVTKEATCTEAGSKSKTCSGCGKVYTKEIAATGHSYGEASCTEAATCTVCGASSGTTLGHSYTSVVTKPTCDSSGYTTYTCSVCGDSYKDNYVSAAGHTYTAKVTAPGCTTDGYTTYTCTTCGDSYKDSYVSASGHSWTEATCNTAMTCATCGAVSGNSLGHSYKSLVTAPGCTTDGYTTYTCTICGDSYKDSYVSASGHSWSEATCTAPMTCTACGKTNGNALGHSYKSVVTTGTCLTDGYTTYTCLVCGHSYKDNYVTASGHSWTDATCTAPMTCTVCGNTAGTALGHSYVGGVCQNCGEAEPSTVIKPTMTVTGTSLSFEDEIFYNIYYTVDDASSVVEMGLVTFTEKLADGTHENAVDVIPGYVSGGGEYMVHTNGIPAKNMGD